MALKHLRSGREAPLFSALVAPAGFETIVADDGDVRLYRGWLERARADALLWHIRATTVWTRERRKMYDRYVDVPRDQAWVGDGRDRPWTPELDAVRRELEHLLAIPFAYVLLNRYRDGKDSVAWHNDRSVAGMDEPAIASLTLGATRAFDVRSKRDPAHVISIDVDHGDLIVMRGATQMHYDHRVRKDPSVANERINLTFRQEPADLSRAREAGAEP